MRSACVRSTACFASRNGASGVWRIAPPSTLTATVRTGAGAAPRTRESARMAPIWNVASAGPSTATSASSRPWNTGRTNRRRPPSLLRADAVGHERAAEADGQRRREVARLVGVREEHARPAARRPPPGRGPTRTRRACTARAPAPRRASPPPRRPPPVRRPPRRSSAPSTATFTGPPACCAAAIGLPAGPVQGPALLFGDDQNHEITRASSRSAATSALAASAGLPPIICVCLRFSGT